MKTERIANNQEPIAKPIAKAETRIALIHTEARPWRKCGVGLPKDRVCRRCGCTHTTPCADSRIQGPCCWAEPDLCSACLTDEEFVRFMEGDGRPSRGKNPKSEVRSPNARRGNER